MGRLTPKPSSPSLSGPACVSTLTPGQLEGQKAFGAALPPDLLQGQCTVRHRSAGGLEPRPRLSGTTRGPRCSCGRQWA